jgi:holo-[acyl-carrier protein] synthase
MILGIGNDIVDIRRIEETLGRFGARFTDRIFTEVEQQKSDKRLLRAASYAKRFAAKEACSKALGTGFRKSVFWKDMGVVNEMSGRPTMVVTGGAKAQLDSLVPAGMKAKVHLTITDDYPYAQAVVMIEAVS